MKPWITLMLLCAGCALGACTKATPHAQVGIELLGVPVRSSELRPHAEFQAKLERAASAGESWPKDPTQVALRFARWSVPSRERVAVLHGSGEQPASYHVVLIANGFADDSIQGERLDVELEQADDRTWQIRSARASWRCWSGRGHTDFGIERCS